MKFIGVHLKTNNKDFAVNPLQLTALKPLEEGGTRIYYTDILQHDDIAEDYDTIVMKINDVLEGWL